MALRLAPLPIALALTAQLAAQHGRGDLTVAILRDPVRNAMGGLHLVDRSAGSAPLLGGQQPVLAELTSLCPSPWGMNRFFGGTDGTLNAAQPGFCHIVEVFADRGTVTAVRQITAQALDEVFLAALQVIGDQVYYLGQNTIARVDTASGLREHLYRYSTGQGAFGLATDGRWLYAGLTARDVFRINLRNLADVQLLVHLPGAFLNVLTALAWSSAETLLAATSDPLLGAFLYEIDPVQGSILRSLPLPLLSVRSLASDPLTGEVLLSGMTASGHRVVSVQSWTNAGTVAALPGEGVLALRRSWPLHRSGTVCETGDQREPRIDATGVPLRGSASYAVGLQTRPGRPSALLAAPRPAPGQGSPLSLTPFGAPNCVVAVQPLGAVVVVTDAAGRAAVTIPIPNSGALRDATVDFQWLVLDPTANALGIAVTQTGTAVVD